MESRESWERRWQLAKQRTDAKIIELHQISGNVQVKILYQKIFKIQDVKFGLKWPWYENDRFSKVTDVTGVKYNETTAILENGHFDAFFGEMPLKRFLISTAIVMEICYCGDVREQNLHSGTPS